MEVGARAERTMATLWLTVAMWAIPHGVRPCPDAASACDAVFDWSRCACLEGRVRLSYGRGVRVLPVEDGHAVWVGAELVVVVGDEVLGDLLRAVAEGATASELSAAGWKMRVVTGP